ncbi:MAG: phospholipase D-like domain-containing protein [Patescibacteria group bacterium]
MTAARKKFEQTETAKLSKFPIAPSNIDLIQTPREFGEYVFDRIAKAQHRIWISALYIQNDATGNKILDALRAAKEVKPDLEIKIFVDFHRNQRARIGEKKGKIAVDAFKKTLASTRIDVFGIPVSESERGGVLHTKGIIIDDEVIYSGASFNDVYLHGEKEKEEDEEQAGKIKKWLRAHIKKITKIKKEKEGEKKKEEYRVDRYWTFTDADFAESFVEYLRTVLENSEAKQDFTKGRVELTEATRTAIAELRIKLAEANFPAPKQPKKIGDAETYVIPVAGFGENNQATQALIDVINSATEELVLYTPYFNPPEEVRAAIKSALARKVKVQIIAASKTANDFFRDADEIRKKPIWKMLLDPFEAGKMFFLDTLAYFYEQNLREFMKDLSVEVRSGLLEVFEWEDGKNTFHAKGASADRGKVSVITGHNTNERGACLDPENGVVSVTEDERLLLKTQLETAQFLVSARQLKSFADLPFKTKYPLQMMFGAWLAKHFKKRL